MSLLTIPTKPTLLLLAAAVAAVWIASLMQADANGLSLLGYSLPSLCFYEATGLACPGCGTTRAGVFLLQGQVLDSLRMQPALPLFLLAGVFRHRRFSTTQPNLARNFAVLGFVVACINLLSHKIF